MMIIKDTPTDPITTLTGIPADNTNSKEKVKQHAILFIDLGRVFIWIHSKINEVEMVIRQHTTPAEQNPGTSSILKKLRHDQIGVLMFNCVTVREMEPIRCLVLKL